MSKTVATKLMLACGPSQPKPLLLRPAAAREACHPPPMRSLEHFTVLQSVGQFGNPAMIKAAVAPAARVLLACGTDAGAVIHPGGGAREAPRLLAAVHPRTDKPIRYIISTHAHPDHIFGHAAFEHEGAEFVGHRNLPRALTMRGQFYLDAYRRSMGQEIMADGKIIPPTRLIDGTGNLDLGARTLTLQAWPTAHTDNDLTVLDEHSGTLFAGDLVVAQHVPVLDGSILGWLKVMDELALMQTKRILPGHGPIIDNWQDALAQQRRYLERLTRDVRSLISRGAPISAAARSAGETEKDRWSLFEEYNARNATAAFAELEWE